MLVIRVQLVHQHPFSEAAPQPHMSKAALGSLFVLSQVQDFALACVKLYVVLPKPTLPACPVLSI